MLTDYENLKLYDPMLMASKVSVIMTLMDHCKKAFVEKMSAVAAQASEYMLDVVAHGVALGFTEKEVVTLMGESVENGTLTENGGEFAILDEAAKSRVTVPDELEAAFAYQPENGEN